MPELGEAELSLDTNPNDPFGIEAARKAVLDAQPKLQDDQKDTTAEQSTQTPQETVQDGAENSEEDETPKYSRRDAQRLAEELQKSKDEQARIQSELDNQTRELDAAGTTVRQAIGTEDEYKAAYNTMLHDADSSKRENARLMVQRYDANRAFFGKVFKYAEAQLFTKIKSDLQSTASLDGIDPKVLFEKNDLKSVLTHVYEAGKVSAGKKADEEIATLKAELKAAKAGRVNNTRTSGQGSLGDISTLDNFFDEKGQLKSQALTAAKQGLLAG